MAGTKQSGQPLTGNSKLRYSKALLLIRVPPNLRKFSLHLISSAKIFFSSSVRSGIIGRDINRRVRNDRDT